jgi:hypothetical protein
LANTLNKGGIAGTLHLGGLDKDINALALPLNSIEQ